MRDPINTAFDEFLLLALKSGDRRAGDRLAARWHPRLLRTARRILGEDALAQDAVQEAWVGICRNWRGLREPSRFPAFAYGIVARKCADQQRRRVRDRRRIDDTSDPDDASATSSSEDQVSISQAFGALPTDLRIAATLYFAEGLTAPEIAAALKIPVGTVKSRIFTARRALKAALKGD